MQTPEDGFDSLVRAVLDASAGKQIAANALELDENENLFDLGLTSIGFISMIIEFEERLAVVFEEEEFELANFNCIAAIRQQIARKLDEKARGEKAKKEQGA